jgi:hypothetical protein
MKSLWTLSTKTTNLRIYLLGNLTAILCFEYHRHLIARIENRELIIKFIKGNLIISNVCNCKAALALSFQQLSINGL